jgi:hypothetical protein
MLPVRFVAAVADGPCNTRYRAVASLTRTGLPPAGSDQLILTHPPGLGRSRITRPSNLSIWTSRKAEWNSGTPWTKYSVKEKASATGGQAPYN